MTEQLKPCPFCGGLAKAYERTCDKSDRYDPSHRAYPIVRCGSCGCCAEGKDWTEPDTAIEAWNRRARPAQPAQTGAGCVLSNDDMHPTEEIAHLKDLLGKANALARIRAERIKELEAQAGAEPVAWWLVGSNCVEFEHQDYHVGPEWEPLYTHPPARMPLSDEQMDAVIEAAHNSLRHYKYSIRGQQITQFDGIEAHVVRETERAHDIKE